MSNSETITGVIKGQGILPLYFNADESVSAAVLRAVYGAGIKAVEYTNRGEAAFKNFKRLIELKNHEMPGLMLGIGTIKNLQEAEAYISEGADFLVSPGFVEKVATYAVDRDIFYAPGCMTPGEIIAAENYGIKFIKLFPGNILGTAFLTSIRDIFPKLLFMPTGGVDTTRESIAEWFKAGVAAVGMGSKLISKKLMETKDYAAIGNATKQVLEIIASVRNS